MITIKIKTWKDWKKDFIDWVKEPGAQDVQGVCGLYGGFTKTDSLPNNRGHL